MPTLRVPMLNLSLPLEEFEGELGKVEVGEIVHQVREALLQWLGGMAEVSPQAFWDGKRWTGSLLYRGHRYEWTIE